ncbi:MAG: hypothetical protein AAF891_11350 [Pseudomonadota bacterium]
MVSPEWLLEVFAAASFALGVAAWGFLLAYLLADQIGRVFRLSERTVITLILFLMVLVMVVSCLALGWAISAPPAGLDG